MKRSKKHLRLYITENAPHSLRSIVNLNNLLNQLNLRQYYFLEILDIHKYSQKALADRVQVVPTLLKFTSKGPIRLMGDLSDQEAVKKTLNLE